MNKRFTKSTSWFEIIDLLSHEMFIHSSIHTSKICLLSTKSSIDDTSLIVEMIWLLKAFTTHSTMFSLHRSNSKFINSKRDEQSSIVSTFHWLTRINTFIRRRSKQSMTYARSIAYVCQSFKSWNSRTVSSNSIFDHREMSAIRKREFHTSLSMKFRLQVSLVIVHIEFCSERRSTSSSRSHSIAIFYSSRSWSLNVTMISMIWDSSSLTINVDTVSWSALFYEFFNSSWARFCLSRETNCDRTSSNDASRDNRIYSKSTEILIRLISRSFDDANSTTKIAFKNTIIFLCSRISSFETSTSCSFSIFVLLFVWLSLSMSCKIASKIVVISLRLWSSKI